MHYKGTIYKFKIEFTGCGAGKNPMRGVLTPSDSLQIDRTVGVLVHQKYRKTSLTKALQTNDFLIKCSERPWKIGKKVGFRLRGKELGVHDFMLLLNVAAKEKRVTVVSSGVSLRDKPHARSTHSRGETQQGGTDRNGTTETRQSSFQQGHDLEQQTSTNKCQKPSQGPEHLPRTLQSGSRQQHEPSSRQMERISRPSPRQSHNSPKSLRNVKSSRQMQNSQERSPKQLRKSPRLLLSEKSPVQVRRSPTVSPRQFSSTANLSVQEKSPKQVNRHPDISPRMFHKSSRFCRASSNQSSPLKTPEKHVIPEISPRVLRRSPRLRPVRSSQSSPMDSSEKHAFPEVSPRFLRKSPRLCSVRSSQSSPLKSPKRFEVLDQLLLDQGKLRQRSRSIGSKDNKIAKRLGSNSTKLLASDVTATEKLLHPLDKEFVRREYEQEELRLLNLAKPSTTSAERKAWLSSS